MLQTWQNWALGEKLSFIPTTTRALFKLDKQNTGKVIALICLDNVDRSPNFILHRKVCQIFWNWWLKIDVALRPLSQTITLEQSQVTVQVADKSVIFNRFKNYMVYTCC